MPLPRDGKCFLPAVHAGCGVRPEPNNFSRFEARHTIFHSWRTLSRPRRLKRRKPRCSLIWPKTGSSIALRIFYMDRPASVRSLCRIAIFAVAWTGGGSLAVSIASWCFFASRSDMQIDAGHAFVRRVGLAPVTRIGAGCLRRTAHVLLHLV